MEEKKKSNAGLVILVVLLLLMCVGMGGFIFINKDKLMAKENPSSTVKSDKKDTNDSNCQEEIEKEVISLSPIKGHAVLYGGEVYVNVYDTTPNIDSVYGEGTFQKLVKTRESYKEYSFEKMTAKLDGQNTKWLKLDVTNAKHLYNNDYGQGLSSTNPKYGLLILNEDNSVSYISTKDLIDGKTSVTKLSVTNVKSIVSEDNMGITTYVIDENDKKTDVNELIK